MKKSARFWLAATALGAAGWAATAPAQAAADVYWSVGISQPGLGVTIGNAPMVVQQPVWVQYPVLVQHPILVQPAVVYRPWMVQQPVVMQPPMVPMGWQRGRHLGWRHHNHPGHY